MSHNFDVTHFLGAQAIQLIMIDINYRKGYRDLTIIITITYDILWYDMRSVVYIQIIIEKVGLCMSYIGISQYHYAIMRIFIII